MLNPGQSERDFFLLFGQVSNLRPGDICRFRTVIFGYRKFDPE